MPGSFFERQIDVKTHCWIACTLNSHHLVVIIHLCCSGRLCLMQRPFSLRQNKSSCRVQAAGCCQHPASISRCGVWCLKKVDKITPPFLLGDACNSQAKKYGFKHLPQRPKVMSSAHGKPKIMYGYLWISIDNPWISTHGQRLSLRGRGQHFDILHAERIFAVTWGSSKVNRIYATRLSSIFGTLLIFCWPIWNRYGITLVPSWTTLGQL